MYFTDRQLKVLAFVHGFTQTHGIAPTLKEIAAHFGVTKVTAHEHLRALEKKRAIRRSRHQARSIELVNGPPTRTAPATLLPIAGELRSGNALVYSSKPAEIDVASLVPTKKNGHVLRVVGDELAPIGINDGDLLIIEPRGQPLVGELALVALDRSRAVLGTYRERPTAHVVVGVESDGKTVPADSSSIRGVVRAVVRQCSIPRPNEDGG